MIASLFILGPSLNIYLNQSKLRITSYILMICVSQFTYLSIKRHKYPKFHSITACLLNELHVFHFIK